MAAINVQPIILNDCLMTVGTDSYEAALSKVQFDPSSSVVRWKGLTPASRHAFGTTADWSCTLEYAQDWSTANSLSQYLMANQGKPIVVKFTPKKGATPGAVITATIIVAPGSIGGSVDAVATASVTVGVQGEPKVGTT